MGELSERKFESFILAALLHDIGKFYQRTGEKLEAEDEPFLDLCCRRFKTTYGEAYAYKHAVYSGSFVRKYLRAYPDVGPLVMYHHVPENCPDDNRYLAKLITLSDWLSAGERRDREEDEESGEPDKTPIISILSSVSLDGKKPKRTYLRLSELDERLENLFPIAEKDLAISGDRFAENSYPGLWKRFLEEFNRLDQFQLLDELYFLLQKFTISIPSSTYREIPDVSLFHHSKSVAAIGGCLFRLDLHEEMIERAFRLLKGEETLEAIEVKEPFIFLGGDISGIQDFIYSVTTEKALKGLRGRSFYLQLLSEVVARRILNLLSLPETNLIYSGGGNFYLLLPNTSDVVKKIEDLRKEVDEVLIDSHKGKLSLAMAYEPLTWLDFSDFSGVWGRLGKKLATSKRRKFSHLFSDPERRELFEPFEEGGELAGCAICGEELGEEGECDFCKSFTDLSNELIRARCIRINEIRPSRKASYRSWKDVIESLGFIYEFSGREDRRSHVINTTDFSGRFRGYRFIGRQVAREESEILTLEHIAERAKGARKWGVLRADVDDLGRIFKEGLGEEKTISRTSMLSFMISTYFSRRIDVLLSENYKDRASVIYSGGDDLLIVAPWSDLPDIAIQIYEDFRKFSSYNFSLTSAIYLAPSKKFPIYESAKSAGFSLEVAKDHGKDRLNFLDVPIPWNDFRRVKEMTEIVRSLLEDYGQRSVPKSLISVLSAASLEKELLKQGKISLARVWRLFYAFRRLSSPYKDDDEQMIKLNSLLTDVVTDYEIMPYLDVVTRWADLLVRKEG